MNAITDSARQHEKRPQGRLLPARKLSKAALRGYLAFLLAGADLVGLIAAFWAGSLLRFGLEERGRATELLGSFLPIYLVTAFALQAYSGGLLHNLRRSVTKAWLTLATASGILAMVLVFAKASDGVSRLAFSLSLTLAVVFVTGLRTAHVWYVKKRLGTGLYAVVELSDMDHVGASAAGKGLLDVRGLFDLEAVTPESYNALAHLIDDADRVIVHCTPERRSAWALVLKGMNVNGEVVCDEFYDLQPLGIATHAGRSTLVVARGPLDLRSRILKRGFDFTISALVVIGLMPLFVLIALLIKIESPGPVFFRQPRIGRQNRLFQVYKFRSMHDSMADVHGNVSTGRGDSRVTRVGKFIRRTSIDELPQFFNVLVGDMSIVGPRPHAVSSKVEQQLFWEIDKRYWLRHACRPGITGLAQIRGYRGTTHLLTDLTNRVDADLNYLQSWSFWGDVKIIFSTIKVVVHQNAY